MGGIYQIGKEVMTFRMGSSRDFKIFSTTLIWKSESLVVKILKSLMDSI